MKKKVIAAVITVVILGSVCAWAAGPGRGGRRGGNMGDIGWCLHHPKVAEKAGLTAEDIEILKEIRYKSEKKLIPLQAKRQLAEVERKYLFEQDEVDEEALRAAVEAVGLASVAVEKARLHYQLQAREQLGEEKIQNLKEAQRKFRRQMMQRGKTGQRDQRKGNKRSGRGRQAGRQDREEFPPPFEGHGGGFEMMEEGSEFEG